MKTLLIVLLIMLLPGCSLIGMGIGTTFPKYTETKTAEVGDDVSLTTADGTRTSGCIQATDGKVVTIAVENASPQVVPIDRVKDARRREGSYWMTGLFIGLAIDVASVVVAAIAASNVEVGPTWWGYH